MDSLWVSSTAVMKVAQRVGRSDAWWDYSWVEKMAVLKAPELGGLWVAL